MILRNIFRMATSTPFTDIPMGVYWNEDELFHEQYKVGRVVRTLAGNELGWMADPYWNENEHFFDTEEEAKAWLVAMYKMGDGDGAKLKRRVRPAAK